MKYLYLVLISIFSFSGQLCAQEIVETAYFAENPELGGDVIIQKAVRSIEKNSTTGSPVLDEQKLCGGKYSYDLNLNHNGVVLVKLVINGHINVEVFIINKNL